MAIAMAYERLNISKQNNKNARKDLGKVENQEKKVEFVLEFIFIRFAKQK